MALSGTISKYITGREYRIEWSATQNVVGNYSDIACTHKLINNAYYDLYISSRSNTCTINGTSKTYTSSAISTTGNSTITLGTTTHRVYHNSDGTKSTTITGVFNIQATLAGSYVSSITASGDITLNTIPRASTLNITDGTLDVAKTITASTQISPYSHTLTWKSGDYSGTIGTEKSSATSWTFTPPMNLATGSLNVTTVLCEFTLQTYSGENYIGSTTKSVNFTIPESVKPSCTIAVSDATGRATTYGGYVQSKSKIRVVVTPDLTNTYGATASSYDVTIDGNKFTSNDNTSDFIKNSGSVSITAKVTDSRGRVSDEVTTSVTVIPYSAPSIGLLKVNRCTSAGVEDDNGSYCKVTYSHNITSLNNANLKNVTLKYKKTSETSWTSLALDTSHYTSDNATRVFAAADDSSYDIALVVTDSFGSTTQQTKLSTAYTLIHYVASGKGIAFGTVVDHDGFTVAMPSNFNDAATFNSTVKGITPKEDDELTTKGYVDSKTYIYWDKPNLIDNDAWVQGNGETASTTRVSSNLVYFESGVKYVCYTNNIYYHAAFLCKTDANGNWISWKYFGQNSSGNSVAHVGSYTPTESHWGRVGIIYKSDATVTPAQLKTEGVYVTLIPNTSGQTWDARWLVKRTGDYVELNANLPATQVAISSSVVLSNDYVLPVAMDSQDFTLQITPSTYYVSRTNYQSDHHTRTLINNFLKIDSHSSVMGFTTSNTVTGISTSDYGMRTLSYSEYSGLWSGSDGVTVRLSKTSDTTCAMQRIRIINPDVTIPAGTYKIGIDSDSAGAENLVSDATDEGKADRKIEAFVIVSGDNSGDPSQYKAVSNINGSGSPYDWYGRYGTTDTFTVTEPTTIEFYISAPQKNGNYHYDYYIKPWIRRIK